MGMTKNEIFESPPFFYFPLYIPATTVQQLY